ncbi:ExbD/TolR family protein [Marinomonas sp. 2405UD68-3]|uniref:ExbD/TolR family protein n=1 Tax=Marinomonas sp. 2405UD68-3 TaxID=3391835 RepID=UPI0039C992EF
MLLEISTQRKNSISITPLIDVVFILLLFFMLSSTFNLAKQIELNASSGALSLSSTIQKILLHSETEVIINDVRYQWDSPLIAEQLKGFGSRGERVVLAARSHVRIQRVITLIDQVYAAGVTKLNVSGSVAP